MANVRNFADDMIFHACGSHLESLTQRLDYDSVLAIK